MTFAHDSLAPKSSTNRKSITLLQRKKPGICTRAYRLSLMGALMLCAASSVAQPSEAQPPALHAPRADSSILIDRAACSPCHEKLVKSFADNPHGTQALVDGGKGVACESCHGPGTAHTKNGEEALIFDPATAAAKRVDEKCLACHIRHGQVKRSAHGQGSVSCVGCHAIHAPGVPKHLLKIAQPSLCFQCHSDVKSPFSMPFHHKVEEGLIECTDCHDVHGAFGENTFPSSKWQFTMCTKCHTATAGPFIYEHAVVKAEGCSACHLLHGGQNLKMLIKSDVNAICQRCHLPSQYSATSQLAVPGHIQSTQSESCISCHESIHGSNTSDTFLGANAQKR